MISTGYIVKTFDIDMQTHFSDRTFVSKKAKDEYLEAAKLMGFRCTVLESPLVHIQYMRGQEKEDTIVEVLDGTYSQLGELITDHIKEGGWVVIS